MANKDLRNWIDDIAAAGELKVITGAEPKRGDRRHRRHLPAADGQSGRHVRRGAGLPQGLIACSPTFSPRCRASTSRWACRRRAPRWSSIHWWRNYMSAAPELRPARGQWRPAPGQCPRGQGRQHREDSDAGLARAGRRPLHRHRLHGGDEGSGFRLDQLRLLSRPEPGARRCDGDDVARQARPHHHEQVSRPQSALPGRRRRRNASGACSCWRDWRFPYGKSEFEAAGGIFGEPSRSSTCRAPGCRCRPMPRSPSKALHPSRRRSSRRARSANGPATTPAAARPEPAIRIATFMHRNDPDPARRHTGGAAERQHVLSRHLPLRRGMEPARGGRRPRGQGACGRMRPAAAGSGSRSRSSSSMAATPSRRASSLRNCHAGAYSNRWTIVVDDDIDPTNINDVIWAMCTRCDPREDVDIVRGCWSIGARSHVLRRRYRPAQRPRRDRRLQAVRPTRHFPDRRALEQGT